MEPLQNKNAKTVGQHRRAGANGGNRNFVVTTDLGNKFATLDRELPEAVHRTKAAGPPRQVPAQQGPYRPARKGGGGRGRLPSADKRQCGGPAERRAGRLKAAGRLSGN